MKRFLLIGLEHESGPLCMEQAKKRNISVVLGDTRENLAKIPHLVSQAEGTLEFDYQNCEEARRVVEEHHAQYPFDGIFTYREYAVLSTAYIAEAIDLPWNSVSSIQVIRNKHLTRKCLSEAGLKQPKSIYCKSAQDAIETFELNQHISSWIIKPASGSGSMGVFKVTHLPELKEAIHSVSQIVGESGFLLEEYIIGQEYSVEGIVDKGRAVTLAVTEKHTTHAPNFVETGHVIPAPIEAGLRAQIANEVDLALQAIGIQTGLFHVEVFVSNYQVMIGEVHARPGGDFIELLVESALSIEYYGLAFDQQLGLPMNLENIDSKQFATIQFLLPSPGVVTKIEGLDKLKFHPNVIRVDISLKEGSVIPEVSSSFTRSGSFIVVAESYKKVRQLTDELLSGIKLEVREEKKT